MHERNNVARFQVALNDKIIARAASLRPPVNNLTAPHRMIAQEMICQMLNSVQSAQAQCWLSVRQLHANVEDSNHATALYHILSRHINAPQQLGVVDIEASNIFHKDILLRFLI